MIFGTQKVDSYTGKMVVLLLPLISVMPMLQCQNVVLATASTIVSFTATLHCHWQLILLFPLLHQLLLIQLFTLLLDIIATYTGADVTIAIYFTKQSAPMTASLVVIYSELIHHFLLLF